jgi:quercetin dioxygenase-like cupin family protein
MKHVKRGEREPRPVSVEGASGVSKADLIAKSDGAPGAVMRLFEIAAGGNTPFHAHDWEHVVYVLEGQGTLETRGKSTDFGAGDTILVEPDEEHNFVNRGGEPLRFLCVVPLRGDA